MFKLTCIKSYPYSTIVYMYNYVLTGQAAPFCNALFHLRPRALQCHDIVHVLITPRRATSGALGKQCLQKVESRKKQQRQHFTVPLNRRMPKRIGGGPIRHTAYLHISLDRFLFTLQLSFALRSPLSRGLASRGNTAIRRHAARKTGSVYS